MNQLRILKMSNKDKKPSIYTVFLYYLKVKHPNPANNHE